MDKITKDRRSENMRSIRSKHTTPEIAVRGLLRAMGYIRYHLHRDDLPGKPDIVFPVLRKAIFVHGCFWHQHPSKRCVDSRKPASNTAYWSPKLVKNVLRDRQCRTKLNRLGWQTLVVWDCQIRYTKQLESRLRRFLDSQNRRELEIQTSEFKRWARLPPQPNARRRP